MKRATSLPTSLADQWHRQELTRKIFSVVNGNGTNARPVYYGLESVPKGGMKELINTRLFDAVRAEVGGTTVTVEITPERHGEQNESDHVCLACYDFEDFLKWFFALLEKSGISPAPPVPVSYQNNMAPPRIRPAINNLRRPKKGR